MEREAARRREAAAPSKNSLAPAKCVADEPLQIVRRLTLHAGGNFFGEKFEQKIGHHIHAKPGATGRAALL